MRLLYHNLAEGWEWGIRGEGQALSPRLPMRTHNRAEDARGSAKTTRDPAENTRGSARGMRTCAQAKKANPDMKLFHTWISYLDLPKN